MIYPIHNVADRSRDLAGRQRGSLNHDQRQTQSPRRPQFGLRALATCVLGNDMGNLVRLHQGDIACFGKRSARQDDGRVGQRQRTFRRINKAQQVMVVGADREIAQGLLADGKKDTGWRIGQSGYCGGSVWNHGPAIHWQGCPGAAFQRDQRQLQRGSGGYGVPAHLRCKRVRRIDDMGDFFGDQVVDQPRHATKAADTGGQWLLYRRIGAASVGKHRFDASVGQFLRHKTGLGGAAKKKDVHGG